MRARTLHSWSAYRTGRFYFTRRCMRCPAIQRRPPGIRQWTTLLPVPGHHGSVDRAAGLDRWFCPRRHTE